MSWQRNAKNDRGFHSSFLSSGRGYEALAIYRLGEVGEGLGAIDRTQPLTQLRLASKLASLSNPLPKERAGSLSQPRQCSSQPLRLCRFLRMIGAGLFDGFGLGLFHKGGVVQAA